MSNLRDKDVYGHIKGEFSAKVASQQEALFMVAKAMEEGRPVFVEPWCDKYAVYKKVGE
jgi:hypothetical protein